MSLIAQSISCLHETRLYLNAVSAAEYQIPIPLLSNSTIGQHTRHFIEFFQCLAKQSETGLINYDLRKRDKRIEEDPLFALSRIENIIARFGDLDLEKPVLLRAEHREEISVQTTISRELLYNLEHCIHHLAIIKIGLAIIKPALELPDNFGMASSTIKHRKQQSFNPECTAEHENHSQ